MKLSLRSARAIAIAIAWIAVSACSPTRYSYAPVTTTTSADLAGVSAAVYGVPPAAPRGEVRVAMLGVGSPMSVSATGGGAGTQDRRSNAIHIALAVSNRSDETWTIDPSEQHVALTLKRQRSDIYAVGGGAAQSSTVAVLPRSTRMIDLYFPLPIQLHKDDAPPPFDVIWTVHAGGAPITQRTSFERYVVSPTSSDDRELRKPDELRDNRGDLPGTENPEHTPILPMNPLDPLDDQQEQ